MGGGATRRNGRDSWGNVGLGGEASSTGLHGADRVASNGLLGAVDCARICAVGIASALDTRPLTAPEIAPDFQPGGISPDANAVDRLRRCMTNNVGVVRDADGWKLALTTIAKLEADNIDCPGFVNMTATATLIAAAALLREESRGAHYRSDFPAPKGDTGHRSMLTLSEALALRDKIAKETA